MFKNNIFTFLFCLLLSLNLTAQKPDKKDNDDSKKPKKEKTFEEIITKEAITNKGLFDIHKVKEKYYYEINNINFIPKIVRYSATQNTIHVQSGGRFPLRVQASSRFYHV